jgi:hypothetical protein
MSNESIRGAPPLDAGDARRAMNGQLQRQRWEAAWIEQQSDVSGVVEYDARPSNGDSHRRDARASVMTGADSMLAAQNVSPRQSADRLNNGYATTAPKSAASVAGSSTTQPALGVAGAMAAAAIGAPGSLTTGAAASLLATTAAKDTASSLSARAAQDASALLAAQLPAHPSAPSAHSALRPPPQSAAAWRDGDSVRMAMRLKDSTRAAAAIAVLGDWLRDAGLKLREARVNGKLIFKFGRDHGY